MAKSAWPTRTSLRPRYDVRESRAGGFHPGWGRPKILKVSWSRQPGRTVEHIDVAVLRDVRFGMTEDALNEVETLDDRTNLASQLIG